MDYPNVFISGKMCSGKSTASKVLVEKLGYEKLSFARQLKLIAALAIGEDREKLFEGYHGFDDKTRESLINYLMYEIYHLMNPGYSMPVITGEICDIGFKILDYWKEHPEEGKPRQFYQWIGTECFRNIDKDIFVKFLEQRIKVLNGQHIPVVLDDGRFRNEAEWAKHLGMLLIRVEIEPALQAKRYIQDYGQLPSVEARNHSSETDLDNFEFDVTVSGAMPMKEFKELVVSLVE